MKNAASTEFAATIRAELDRWYPNRTERLAMIESGDFPGFCERFRPHQDSDAGWDEAVAEVLAAEELHSA